MASDERHEGVPDKVDGTVPEGEATPATETPTGFPDRWSGGPDDSTAAAVDMGEKWASGEPDNSGAKADEMGDRWGGGADDSAERAGKFGPTWSGDNQGEPEK